MNSIAKVELKTKHTLAVQVDKALHIHKMTTAVPVLTRKAVMTIPSSIGTRRKTERDFLSLKKLIQYHLFVIPRWVNCWRVTIMLFNDPGTAFTFYLLVYSSICSIELPHSSIVPCNGNTFQFN